MNMTETDHVRRNKYGVSRVYKVEDTHFSAGKRGDYDWCEKKKEVLKNEKENCKDWIVDHR